MARRMSNIVSVSIKFPFSMASCRRTTFIFVSHIPLLLSLHLHDPSLSPDQIGESSRLARFQLKKNPFSIRSAELERNISVHYPHNLCSSSESCIVLGPSGSGKSALRISIENELSKENKRPFVVSLTEPQQLDHFLFEFKSKFSLNRNSFQESLEIKVMSGLVRAEHSS
jgi:hypothetical protein